MGNIGPWQTPGRRDHPSPGDPRPETTPQTGPAALQTSPETAPQTGPAGPQTGPETDRRDRPSPGGGC